MRLGRSDSCLRARNVGFVTSESAGWPATGAATCCGATDITDWKLSASSSSTAGASGCTAVIAERVSTASVGFVIGGGAGATMSTIGVGDVGAGWARSAEGSLIVPVEAIVRAASSLSVGPAGRRASMKSGRAPVFHSAAEAVAITINVSPTPASNPARYEDRLREYWTGLLSRVSGQRSRRGPCRRKASPLPVSLPREDRASASKASSRDLGGANEELLSAARLARRNGWLDD